MGNPLGGQGRGRTTRRTNWVEATSGREQAGGGKRTTTRATNMPAYGTPAAKRTGIPKYEVDYQYKAQGGKPQITSGVQSPTRTTAAGTQFGQPQRTTGAGGGRNWVEATSGREQAARKPTGYKGPQGGALPQFGAWQYGPQQGDLQWANMRKLVGYDVRRDVPGTNFGAISATRYGGFGTDTLKMPLYPSQLAGISMETLLSGLPQPGERMRNSAEMERARTNYATDIPIPEEINTMPEYGGGGGGGGWPGGGGGGGWPSSPTKYPDWWERMYQWRF